jgi:hypothetical protein
MIDVIGTIQLANPTAMDWITFNPCGLQINMKTGEVVIPEGLSLDEASLAFWEGVRRAFPGVVDAASVLHRRHSRT